MGSKASGGRKPTADLKLHGTYRADKHGDREREPVPSGKPRRPRTLAPDAKWMWDHSVPHLIKTGVATAEDQAALEAMCHWWQQFKAATWAGDQPSARKNWELCFRLMSKFGLTPVDRTAIRVESESKQVKDKGKFFFG